MTGSKNAGSGEMGAMMWTLVPGMAKRTVLVPKVTRSLRSRMACLSEPGPPSFVFATGRLSGGIVLPAGRQGENSDVLPAGSVAVAVRYRPGAATGSVKLKLTVPVPEVVT